METIKYIILTERLEKENKILTIENGHLLRVNENLKKELEYTQDPFRENPWRTILIGYTIFRIVYFFGVF